MRSYKTLLKFQREEAIKILQDLQLRQHLLNSEKELKTRLIEKIVDLDYKIEMEERKGF